MSMTLNMIDRLLSMGRNYQDLGRTQEALDLLGRLANFRELPADVAEETQARLGEIQLQRRKYPRARRHFRAALVHQPQSARYHFLMAEAMDGDGQSDPQKAAEHYRQSLKLDPEQPSRLAEFGLLCLRLGKTEEALASLRRAVELAPRDAGLLEKLVQALNELDQIDEVRNVLRAGLFRNSKDARFRKLWNDFQFSRLREDQETKRNQARGRSVEDQEPSLLPFVRPATDSGAPTGRKQIRRDRPSPLAPPHLPRPGHVPDRKHA